MIGIAIQILWMLIGLCILVGIGWVVMWVLEQLGIIVPPMAIKIAGIILGLLVLIYALTLIAGSGGISLPMGGRIR